MNTKYYLAVDIGASSGRHMLSHLENGKIVATGTDLVKMTYRLARSMKKKDTQFITVISGCDVSDEDAEKLADRVSRHIEKGCTVKHTYVEPTPVRMNVTVKH